MFIILGPDNQVDSQSVGPTPGSDGSAHLDSQIAINRTGTWSALLTSKDVGATGSYRVGLGRVRVLN